jgi:hypothetical protein
VRDMTKNRKAVVESACRLALEYGSDHVSVCDLYFRSGYDKLETQIGVDELEEPLSRHPAWVDAWFRFSEDKRSGGWWILATPQGFEVGNVNDPSRSTLLFETKVRACAEYVGRELADTARACKSIKGRLAGAALRLLGDR